MELYVEHSVDEIEEVEFLLAAFAPQENSRPNVVNQNKGRDESDVEIVDKENSQPNEDNKGVDEPNVEMVDKESERAEAGAGSNFAFARIDRPTVVIETGVRGIRRGLRGSGSGRSARRGDVSGRVRERGGISGKVGDIAGRAVNNAKGGDIETAKNSGSVIEGNGASRLGLACASGLGTTGTSGSRLAEASATDMKGN
ncbi:hypothetical protein O6P43_009841 [Quillaja saponaria]|uniref:Uncharacterized protein n=1 Tax=Quillaja saponaria TaxID=32244 RepID=A0AAD7VDP3_QUISA|nr:hypothetical protein O6P43_009841 [Quillaja saponaria]